MRRIAVAAVTMALVGLPAAAAAKGPHATLSSLPQGVEPGQAWATTLTLAEYGGRDAATARPRVILRSGDQRIMARPKLLGANLDVLAESRYRLRIVFPRAGRWTFTVVDGTGRRFRFPRAVVGGGSGRATGGWVAFPEGSRAEAAGGGGPLIGDTGPAPAGQGEPLPPEEVIVPTRDESDGGGIAWVPVAGLTLAGVGGVAVLRRLRRRPG